MSAHFQNRVKSDALFSYQPPFNILAFLLLGPLSLFASPRTLHSVNVFLIRLTVSQAGVSFAVIMRLTASLSRSPFSPSLASTNDTWPLVASL